MNHGVNALIVGVLRADDGELTRADIVPCLAVVVVVVVVAVAVVVGF